jgi:hypothetical protein
MRRISKLVLSTALVGLMLVTLAATSEAQRGRPSSPPRGGGSGGGGPRTTVVVGMGNWGGYWGGGYLGYWGYPYMGWGWGWSPYWWGPYPYYGRYYMNDDREAAMRLQVTPKDTQVYVDGYYSGTVDDFDGIFQRLRARPGEHELVLYLKGYRTVRQALSLKRGDDYKVKFAMTPLAAGESSEPPPLPPARPAVQAEPPNQPGDRDMPRPEPARPGAYQPPPRRAPVDDEPRAAQPPSQAVQAQGFGAVVIRVQPGGAEILVDGERWQGPDGQDRLVIQVPEGSHRIEVRKEGFSSFTSIVMVKRGETVPVNVSLAKVPQE